MNRFFNESVIGQCKAALLPALLTIGLACGGDVFAATAAAPLGSKQLTMTTGSGLAYSVVKLGSIFNSCIDASGQVAFNTSAPINGAAYFYSGGQFQILGTLGGDGAFASAINDYGQVVGTSYLANRGSLTPRPRTPMSGMPLVSSSISTCLLRQQSLIDSKGRLAGNAIAVGSIGEGWPNAFLWTPTKGMVNLGTLYGAYSIATGINNAGEVIGGSISPNVPNNFQGFYWNAVGGMIDLGIASGVSAIPYAINDAGQVVGGASPSSGTSYAFLWTKTGGMVNLGSLYGDPFASASAINNKGQVVGASGNLAFSWTQAGGMIDLGFIPPVFPVQVNVLGQVLLPSSIWTSAGGKVDLGSLGGGNTTAASINNLGQVVGSTNDASGRTRAFLWTSAGGMVDLNTPGLPIDTPLQNAAAIADNGSILATSSGGVTYLLIPNTRRITSSPSESFFQRSPFQRLAPKTLIFP